MCACCSASACTTRLLTGAPAPCRCWQGDKLAKAEDVAGLAAVLRQMQPALPEGVFAGHVAALKPKQQARLQAALQGHQLTG